MLPRTALLAASALAASAAALSPAGLQAAISQAIASRQPTFAIPVGLYNFSDAGIGGLNISGAANLLIDGSGSDLVFYPGFGVTVTSSVNLTIRNLTLDYFPSCFTQGIVAAVNSSAWTLDVDVDPSFPVCSPASTFPAPYFDAGEIKVIFFDPTTRVHIRGQSGANVATFAASPAPGTCRMHIPNFSGFTPQVGWRASISPRIYSTQYKIPDFYRGSTWTVLGSEGVLTQDVTVLGGGNFAFTEWGGEGGHTYERVTLARPRDHLLSSNLDAFHSFSVGAGPTIRASNFGWQGDDAMNFHTRVTLALGSPGPGSIYVIDTGDVPGVDGDAAQPLRAFADVRAGDVLRIFAPEASGGAFKGALVASAPPALVPSPQLVAQAIAALSGLGTVSINPAAVAVWLLPYSSAPPGGVSPDDIVQFDRRACVGGSVADSSFQEAYDSCFRLSACGTALVNTSFTYMPGGVHVVFDQSWLEGSKGIANITVANNSFTAIGAPPFASSMAQVLDSDPDVVNLVVSGNTVVQ